MPKIEKIELADGRTRYRARAETGRWPNGKRRQKWIYGDRKKDVERELARIGYQRARGEYVADSRETVNEMIDAYLRSAYFEQADNTRVSYTNALLPVRERIGHLPIQKVKREIIEVEVRDWMMLMGRRRGGKPGTGLGPRSVRLTLGRLSAAFELACKDGKLAANPARYVKMPSEVKTARSTWSEAELRRFLAVADADRLAAAWRLSLYGLRRGEVCGLRWEDVNLDARTVRIGRARVLVNGRVIVKAPKSERGYRTLPLDDVLTAGLRALHRRQAAERLAGGQAYEASGYVVADELGAAPSPEWFSDEFHRLAAAAGVPRIRLHDGRHTVNSLLAAAGVPDHIRAAWCGHTVAVNVATYTHARPEDLAVAGAALSRICNAV